MERKEQKEGKASSNEAESPEPAVVGDDSIGTSSVYAGGRYYECVFCRRGFSTAQALGGHMNIHRRDRPRIRPAVATAARREEGYHPYNLQEQWHPPTPTKENYIVYFPGSSSSMESKSPRDQMASEKKIADGEMEDLDLELRLGHGGRHGGP
ncbi:hypothetical protein KFK09_010642 [Dendrobium nobile]|uniref:C2H2-type domain-containing protein n=1 Tax=Dendrobium nobile TaxID=94219 RepID=A0A8T3BAH1_DENNO|nr:hypothetical protein KFK09_010642 [Dendrobium nobile]